MGSPPPSPHKCTAWKVVLGIMGDKKRLKRTGFVQQPVLKKCRESCVVMCFLCQGRQKMSEQVHVCSWAACQLSPFAVTHQPVSHYGGALWVVSALVRTSPARHYAPPPRHQLTSSHCHWWFLNFYQSLNISDHSRDHSKTCKRFCFTYFLWFKSDLYLHKV